MAGNDRPTGHYASPPCRAHEAAPGHLAPPEAELVTPDVTLAPLVGWDRFGFRLGYGGGHFDRTLAQLSPRPFVIGVGLQTAALATIHPQPHDIRMDAIVTEEGLQATHDPEQAEQPPPRG